MRVLFTLLVRKMWFVCLLFVRSAMYEKDQQIISLEIGYIESSISFVSNMSMFQNVQTTNWQNFELIDCKINSHFILVVEKSTESNFESPKLWEWHAFSQKKAIDTRSVIRVLFNLNAYFIADAHRIYSFILCTCNNGNRSEVMHQQ